MQRGCVAERDDIGGESRKTNAWKTGLSRRHRLVLRIGPTVAMGRPRSAGSSCCRGSACCTCVAAKECRAERGACWRRRPLPSPVSAARAGCPQVQVVRPARSIGNSSCRLAGGAPCLLSSGRSRGPSVGGRGRRGQRGSAAASAPGPRGEWRAGAETLAPGRPDPRVGSQWHGVAPWK